MRNQAYDDPLKRPSKPQLLISTGHTQTRSEKLIIYEPESQIEWSNLIFLPFHPVFKIFVLYSVLIKTTLGPIQSIYPVVYCDDRMDYHPFLILIKFSYWYVCDSVYGIDTFLHIVHRQVTDKAMRREHLPKSAKWLLCDLISLVPFFHMMQPDQCPKVQIWPNILTYTAFFIIYRVTEYFSLGKTHSYWKLMIGYTVMLVLCLNCINCFWLVLTEQGLCDQCHDKDKFYDWRAYVMYKLNETNNDFTTYVYGFSYIFSFTGTQFLEHECKPSAIMEYVIICFFMVANYILNNFIVIPKTLSESMMRLRRICQLYPSVNKIVQETKRRNSNKKAHEKVTTYYILLWEKRHGIYDFPTFFSEMIPRYLRIELLQDLLWPLFYHSPMLRTTSFPFRRWLTHSVIITYKLPGEILFSSPTAATSIYYIQSGIVQLISLDDGVSPILSVTSGTIFGDISFLVPNLKRRVLVRCLTFCEVYIVKQIDLLRGIQKYPDDRQMIRDSVKERMNHAKVLFASKKSIRGLDRNEDENIAWIKRRWWEIRDHIDTWSKINMRRSRAEIYKRDIPHEEAIWHCAKYIGQLVLCNPVELQTKSMFTRFKFPWILNPTSKFGYVWHKIVTYTVFLVLCLYPSNLVKPEIPPWFTYFSYYSDVVYAIDIGISLFTAVKRGDFVTNNISSVIFERCKSATFMLDIASTIWIEDIASFAGQNKYYYTLQFNRLIKVYILFYSDYLKWHITHNPLLDVCKNIALLHFVFLVITSHFVFEMTTYIPELSVPYFFGENLCSRKIRENCSNVENFLGISIAWSFEWTFSEYDSTCLLDTYIGIIVTYMSFILLVYCRARFMSYLYLKDRDETLFQSFVTNVTRHYKHYRIHPDLLKRLDRYFICHWKYYRGTDVLRSNTLEKEPLEVYWKAQGQVAKNIISSSPAFAGADHGLVMDLACAAKFLILPKKSNIFVFGIEAKNVIWVIQGCIKTEYQSEQGGTITKYSGPGDLLCPGAVLLGRKSLGTYISETDCEIMYIPISKFLYIYKNYNIEYSYVESCIKEFGPLFDDKFEEYVLRHRDYQIKLKDRIHTTKISMMAPANEVLSDVKENRSLPFQGDFWGEPESTFMQTWLLFRCIVAYVSIVCASALGGVGAASRWIFMILGSFCDSIAWIDIIIKLCLPYYNEDGLLITDKRKCFFNYFTKTFVLDIIGALPWFELVRILLKEKIDTVTCFLINTMCKFAHLYILFSYFEYISDHPSVNVTLLMILKWQLVNILIVLGSSHYFMVRCVDMEFEEESMKLITMKLQPNCWMPDYKALPNVLKWDEFHLIFAQSLNFAENGMLSMNFGRFHLDRDNLTVGVVLFGLGLLFWFITCYTLTLLLLDARGDTIYQHNVGVLRRFLKNERVEKPVIHKVMNHFKYYWIRTKGINIQKLTNERIGIIFQQDLNYYFYKKTFSILDSILKGGEIMQKQLAAASTTGYFLPGHDIFREHELISHVCIVHRGRVTIYKNQKKVIVLTKGDIFGQLSGAKIRPVRVTATAGDYADVLYIDYKAFRSIITEDVKHTILRSPQHRNDFMATKNMHIENPYDSVQYLLRGRKILMLPFTADITEAYHGTWYSHWLHFVWLIAPLFSVSTVFLFVLLPKYDYDMHFYIFCTLTAFDLFYVINSVMEFFVIELVVKNNKCIYERIGTRMFANWKIYLDILTVVIPIASFFTLNWRYQLARLPRLRHFYEFEVTFCRGFKSRFSPVLLRFILLVLILHISACGWIYFGCRNTKRTFKIIDMRNETSTVDFSQWMHPDDRTDTGCARVTHNMPPDYKLPSFVVPRYWAHDYILAISYILLIATQTTIDTILTNTIAQVYYKVFITFALYVVDIYIMGYGINAAYTKYRELYQYDFHVQTITTFFKDCGLCPALVETFLRYTEQLWQRQKGDKLPEIAYRAPTSLRNEMFTALYIHHLEAPPTFRELPLYFKQQLTARFQRMVVFPGKCIVREGDSFNTTYFIHEGEVEKWYSDVNGESKLLSVLYTNGYFGIVPGLLNHISFEFSYYARTVVDLVFLQLPNWIDLLDGYPAVKKQLYAATHGVRMESFKNHWGKTFTSPKLMRHYSTETTSELTGHVQP